MNYPFPQIPTKLSLEEGVVPSFYSNKISHVLSNTISLNAFEYYLFQFSNYMLNNSPTVYSQQNPFYLEQLSNANTNPSNVVYFALLESYLNYLVPLSSYQMSSPQTPSSQSSIWQSLSSTTSNLLHLRTGSPSVETLNSTPTQTSTLFKSSILNLKPLLSGSADNQKAQQSSHRLIHDSLGSEIGKCETFLLIVTELWLNHAIPPVMAKRHSSPSKHLNFTPNSDHMRAVRILVKHLHYFANSCVKRVNDSMNLMDVSPLDDIKRSVWSQKYLIQKRLYTFLRMSFDRWPNDTSIRLPLETWLSYIQPWRYVNASAPAIASDFEELISTNSNKSEISLTDHRWKQFISDNLLFYSVIFRQLIPRFCRLLDLSSSKNSLMLFRVTKVFSQTNLSLWIREAENSLMTCDTSAQNILQTNWSTNSRTSLLSPTIRQQNFSSLSTQMRHPLMEMEANNFEYIPLFCPAIKPLIQQLLIEISKALNVVNEIISKAQFSEQLANSSGVSFIQYIISFFSLSEEMTQTDENKKLLIDKKKTKNHLSMASNQLSVLFEVPIQESDLISTQNDLFEGNEQNTPLRQTTADLFEERNGTPKLTSFGRSQVLHRRIIPEINQIEGNPDKQPVRTFEFYYLVHLFLWISDWINKKYGQNIESLYNRPGFGGVFFRQLITGPTYYVKTVKTGNSYRPPERVTEVLKPRINLRFMANKVRIFYTFMVFSLVYLMNYSLLSFISLIFLMYLTYLFTKSLLIHFSH